MQGTGQSRSAQRAIVFIRATFCASEKMARLAGFEAQALRGQLRSYSQSSAWLVLCKRCWNF